MTSKDTLSAWLEDTNARTHALVEGLDGDAWIGPQLEIVNPPQWEVGHVGWFLDAFFLRKTLGRPPLRVDADGFWDSIAIQHGERWKLPLPKPEEAVAYLDEVHVRVQDHLSESTGLSADESYVLELAVLHQDMHNEAFVYTWQTHGYAAPAFVQESWQVPAPEIDTDEGDVEFAAGEIELGYRGDGFCFDNERDSHSVGHGAFAMSKLPVTAGEFAAFVDAGGYQAEEFWTVDGWAWREREALAMPCYWRRNERGDFERRLFDCWIPLTWDLPVMHVSCHEAQAYCRWAQRRLPTEVEWEVAAGSHRPYPWGDAVADEIHANLDWRHGGLLGTHAFPAGDTPEGVRQMFGNVWEWTSSPFAPYPGFDVGVYQEYSQPWFGTRNVLRGGAWCTMARMMRNTFRNFYEPWRNDVWAGFRTCRL